MKIWRDSLEKSEKRMEIYNFDRAHRLNREIKKLDLLDKIRVALTEIGNTMAYVRMIKSGIFHVNSNSISYIPFDDDDAVEFMGMCEGLSKETISAGKFLQQDIDQAMKKIQEGFSYFKKLSLIFSTYFQSSKNSHMKNFYIFVPALTINYIENISIAKDRLNKKNKESLFTDDGFAIGIVFMLKLLNQFTEFNSLNWFKSVKNKIQLEKEKIQKQRLELEKTKGDNLLQTLLLSEKRILEFEMEFKLLFFSINSCKIFFQN
jgi:WASH complex subunit 7